MKRPHVILQRIAVLMQDHGGSFASALGRAMLHADDCNLRRIEAAFPELMNHYAEMLGES